MFEQISPTKANPNGYGYRAVVELETRKRILGYRPSFGEAQNLALERSMDFAHVEKRVLDHNGLPKWERIDD